MAVNAPAETTYDYSVKGKTEGSGSDFAPLPIGRYPFVLDDFKMKAPGPPRNGRDGKPMKAQPRALFTCALPEEAALKVKARAKKALPEGTDQSTKCWASFGYSWAWDDAQGNTHYTKLFEFCADAAGLPTMGLMKAWLAAGGGIDPHWFCGVVFRGTIEHAPNPAGGVYVNVSPQSIEEKEADNYQKVSANFQRHDSALFEKVSATLAESTPGDEDTDDTQDLPF